MIIAAEKVVAFLGIIQRKNAGVFKCGIRQGAAVGINKIAPESGKLGHNFFFDVNFERCPRRGMDSQIYEYNALCRLVYKRV